MEQIIGLIVQWHRQQAMARLVTMGGGAVIGVACFAAGWWAHG